MSQTQPKDSNLTKTYQNNVHASDQVQALHFEPTSYRNVLHVPFFFSDPRALHKTFLKMNDLSVKKSH